MDLATQAAGIGALAEPIRRALYSYVVAQPDAVGREAAAAAVDVPVHSAKFHLDRLVDDGLLQAEYRRISGRSGPGAGRPAKLYRRAEQQFSVSLPERRYDLVAHILARAVERASEGEHLQDALRETAHAEGEDLGRAASAPAVRQSVAEHASSGERSLRRLGSVLATQGYEPRLDDSTLLLANCPFDALAREHTDLVCGLNHSYVEGVVDGLGEPHIQTHLRPVPGRCCVTARFTG